MADEQKPAGSAAPPPKPAGDGAQAPPPKPAPPKAPATMAAASWEGELARELKDRFGDGIREASTYLGQNFVVARPEAVIPIMEYLKVEVDFDYLVDLTAVDWPKRPERFDLVYILYSFSRNERVRIKTAIPEGHRQPSATSVHRTANWLEREVFDMFGIEFAGHPDLRRILLPEDWQGHPLRKENSILQQDQRWVQENLEIESAQ